MSGIADILEAIYRLVQGGFGIRYILSSKYRKEVNERCRSMSKVDIAFEIFETIIGVVFLGIIVYAIASLLAQGSS